MIVGTLEVQMLANLARLSDDMNKAKGMVGGAMADVERTVGRAKAALGALGVGVSLGAFVGMIKGAIDAADHLNDLSKKTGIAVATLGGLGFAGRQAGLDLDSVAAGAGKLNKSLVEAAGGNKEFSVGFSALGIDIKTASGELKKADVVIAEIANKFKDYEDGPEKAAIAVRLFGKAGADMIPLLNEGGAALQANIEYFQRYGAVTQQIAADSDAFNDSIEKVKLLSGAFGRTVAAELLPSLQVLVDLLIESKEKGDGFTDVARGINTIFTGLVVVGANVAYVFKQIGEEIGGVSAQLVALATFDFGAVAAINEDMKSRAASDRKAIDDFSARMLSTGRSSASDLSSNEGSMNGPASKKARAPILPGSGTQGDDPGKKILEGQLKGIERALEQERETIKFHDQYVAEMRAQDLVDLQQYEEFRKRSLETGLAASVRNYDAEIQILERYIGTTTKEVERQAAINKLKEVQDLKEKARQEYIQKSEMLTLGLAKAQNELNKEMKEWVIRQEQSAQQMQFEIDMMGKSAVEVAKLTEARRIELDVEEQIRQARKNGTISDETVAAIQTQAAIAKARASSLIEAKDQKEKDPWFNAQESIRKYGEEADNTGKQIGDAMTNAFRASEDAFVQFAMTGKASSSDMARSIIADLIRIQARKAVASASEGLGGIFGSTFGGSGGGDSGGGGDAGGGFDGGGFSAADGFDIPAGVNPVTQLHEREMVLPAPYADAIRNMADGGKGGGGVMINIAVDAKGTSVEGDDSKSRELGSQFGAAVEAVIAKNQRPGGLLARV